MNLLWLESAIPSSTMAAWVVREGKKYRTYRLSRRFLLLNSGTQTLRCRLNTFVSSSHFSYVPDQIGLECYIQNELAPGTNGGVRRESITH
jgi:hypothetical protein